VTTKEPLGLLQRIVDAEVAAGHDVRVTAPGSVAHGDRPEARLLAARGRGEVEAAWDLGPLLTWVPEARGWRLEDATSGARLSLARTPEDDRPLPAESDRPRLGHPDQRPDLVAWLAAATSAEDELDRLTSPTWDDEAAAATPWREATKQRVVTEAPAREVLERVHEVLAAVTASGADADALPGWFAAACPPAWPSEEHLGAWRALDDLRGREARRAQWRLRWPAAETARQLDPRHRLWRVRMVRVADEHALDVLVDRAPVSHLGPAERLLQVCGAARCEPLPPPRQVRPSPGRG
jgi:hypothetical protein